MLPWAPSSSSLISIVPLVLIGYVLGRRHGGADAMLGSRGLPPSRFFSGKLFNKSLVVTDDERFFRPMFASLQKWPPGVNYFWLEPYPEVDDPEGEPTTKTYEELLGKATAGAMLFNQYPVEEGLAHAQNPSGLGRVDVRVETIFLPRPSTDLYPEDGPMRVYLADKKKKPHDDGICYVMLHGGGEMLSSPKDNFYMAHVKEHGSRVRTYVPFFRNLLADTENIGELKVRPERALLDDVHLVINAALKDERCEYVFLGGDSGGAVMTARIELELEERAKLEGVPNPLAGLLFVLPSFLTPETSLLSRSSYENAGYFASIPRKDMINFEKWIYWDKERTLEEYYEEMPHRRLDARTLPTWKTPTYMAMAEMDPNIDQVRVFLRRLSAGGNVAVSAHIEVGVGHAGYDLPFDDALLFQAHFTRMHDFMRNTAAFHTAR